MRHSWTCADSHTNGNTRDLPISIRRVRRPNVLPGAENTPVVLHLLGASQSLASLVQPLDPATWSLADAGYTSLIVDCRGIGASNGERDVDALGHDAQCMWNTALQLAGHDAERVPFTPPRGPFTGRRRQEPALHRPAAGPGQRRSTMARAWHRH